MAKNKPDASPIPLQVEHLLNQWGKAIRAQRKKTQMLMRDFAYRVGVSLDTLQRTKKSTNQSATMISTSPRMPEAKG